MLYDLKNPAKFAAFCNHFGEAGHKAGGGASLASVK
jgi:hypothetical protein